MYFGGLRCHIKYFWGFNIEILVTALVSSLFIGSSVFDLSDATLDLTFAQKLFLNFSIVFHLERLVMRNSFSFQTEQILDLLYLSALQFIAFLLYVSN